MVLSPTNELQDLLMSQLYGVEHGPTIMWSALTISQMIDVLSDLAEYYQMVLAATNPHTNLFTTNLKTNLRSIKHRQYMVDDPDVVRLASAPSKLRQIGNTSRNAARRRSLSWRPTFRKVSLTKKQSSILEGRHWR